MPDSNADYLVDHMLGWLTDLALRPVYLVIDLKFWAELLIDSLKEL